MEQRRIVLTNLNPSVYTRRYLSSFLTELIINSLLYEEVLIREGDLICNRHITNHLRDPETFEAFKELLKVGAVRILRLDPRSLSPDLKCDRNRQPLSARAEDHMHRRSYKGRAWKPETWEWDLYRRLDEVLIDSPAYQAQTPFPKENDFALELALQLKQIRQMNCLPKRSPFHDIDDNMAETFIAFCSDPEEWVRFLHKNEIKKPLHGVGGDFYRTAAYQCLQVFEHRNGMQRLLESTYAACECDREKADGRYGRSALAELPFVYNSYDEQRAAAETVIKMEVVPVNSRMTIGVAPGIGEIVAATREHQAFRNMQDALRLLAISDVPEKTFNYAWQSLCSVVADNWARKMMRQKPELVDHRIGQICVGLYITFRTLGFVVFHGHKGFDWPVPVDWAAINRIEHWAPVLSQSIRTMTKLPKIHKQLVNAATLRCTKVTLSSSKPEKV